MNIVSCYYADIVTQFIKFPTSRCDVRSYV